MFVVQFIWINLLIIEGGMMKGNKENHKLYMEVKMHWLQTNASFLNTGNLGCSKRVLQLQFPVFSL